MRSHGKELAFDETEPRYHGDTKSGKTVVHCTECGLTQDIEGGSKDEQCQACKRFFVYRPWWEW